MSKRLFRSFMIENALRRLSHAQQEAPKPKSRPGDPDKLAGFAVQNSRVLVHEEEAL